MTYHIFSTLSDKADKHLEYTLNLLASGELTIENAIRNLKLIECYDKENKPYFPDADMTKETKYDFIEYICKITNKEEDEVWEIFDKVYYEEENN